MDPERIVAATALRGAAARQATARVPARATAPHGGGTGCCPDGGFPRNHPGGVPNQAELHRDPGATARTRGVGLIFWEGTDLRGPGASRLAPALRLPPGSG